MDVTQGDVYIVSASYDSLEQARAELPRVLQAEEARAEQLSLDFGEPPLVKPPKEPRRKFTVPKDSEVCRSMAALFMQLFSPGEKTVEETVYRYNVKQIKRALQHMISAGVVETKQGRKRTYYALTSAARERLEKETNNV